MTGASLPIAAVQPTGGRPAGSAAAVLPAAAEDLQALVPGQVLEARVMAALADGRMRLITSLGLIDALMTGGDAATPAMPGQALRLKVETAGAQPVLTQVPQAATRAGPAGLPMLMSGIAAAGIAETTVPAALPESGAVRDQASAKLLLGPLIAQAAARQAGPAALFPAAAALTQAMRDAPETVADGPPVLPALRQDLARLSALRLAPDASPAALEGLLKALGLSAAGANAPQSAPPPVVALLTQLRSRLASSAGEADGAAVTLSREMPRAAPPPGRGLPLQGEPPQAGALAPDAPLADHLAEMSARTDAALSRLGLHALASLPEAPAAPAADRIAEKSWHWSADIPLAFGDRTGSAQIAIDREAPSTSAADGETGWVVRLSFDLPGLGPLDARISLRGERIGVALHAAQADARRVMAPLVPVLESRLRQAGLIVSGITLQDGRAPVPKREQAQTSLFVDRRS